MSKNKTTKSSKDGFDRTNLEDLLKRRYFYSPAFSIYRGVKGLYDYGPPGTAVKNNLLQAWRNHFVLEENILDIETTAITPHVVLATSGHVEKFQDLMVKDEVTGEPYRADHLLEAHLEELLESPEASEFPPEKAREIRKHLALAGTIDNADELHDLLVKYNVKAPGTDNAITKPFFFNLMFSTQIGPSGKEPGFLRPETAQGIFVNFKKLLEFNNGKLPFAASQIGSAYRNEVSPRSGLLRVREFTLAEIEHFLDPKDKSHPKFGSIKDLKVNLLTIEDQLSDNGPSMTTLGDAVSSKVINSETLGYFVGRTHLFLLKVGINPNKLRFRQHLKTEMAHYAVDCWDAEIETSYGWIECVGIADRSTYDLDVHTKATNEPQVAWVDFKDGPRDVTEYQIVIQKGKVGGKFRADSKVIISTLENLQAINQPQVKNLMEEMEEKSEIEVAGFKLTSDMVSFKEVKKKVNGENITPAVIEPSFGIGRILYSLIEHSYRERDEQRTYLSLKPSVAPVKCSVLPLMQKKELLEPLPGIIELLTRKGISHKVDDSSAKIGRRYARTDEIGIPFGITVDYETIENKTVTLRERDSMKQVRIPIDDLPDKLYDLCNDNIVWEEILKEYPVYYEATE